MKPREKKVVFSVYLTENLVWYIKKYSKLRGKTASSLTEDILSAYALAQMTKAETKRERYMLDKMATS